MQIQLLKDIVADIAGKPAVEIVDLLFGKKDVNEFLIARKLKITINQTRNILYKLSAFGLVDSIRKKDKRKGWYIYFWTLDTEKSLVLLEKTVSYEIEQIKNKIRSRQTKRFYICRTCNIEVSEETALLNHFTCNECGQSYELNEDKKIIEELNTKTAKLSRVLESIKKEISLIKAEKDKKLARARRKEEKKKSKEKAKRKTKKRGKKTKKKLKKVEKHKKRKSKKKLKRKKQKKLKKVEKKRK